MTTSRTLSVLVTLLLTGCVSSVAVCADPGKRQRQEHEHRCDCERNPPKCLPR